MWMFLSLWAYFGSLCPVSSVIQPRSSNSIPFTMNEDRSPLWTSIQHSTLVCSQWCPTSLSVPSKAQNVAMPLGSMQITAPLPTYNHANTLSHYSAFTKMLFLLPNQQCQKHQRQHNVDLLQKMSKSRNRLHVWYCVNCLKTSRSHIK